MVGKSIAVRGTRTAPPSRRRRAAWQRAAIIESYELANPAMIDSGDVDVLLAKYAGGLGRLLQRVQVKYDLVALDGCLMYRKAPGARWKEVSAELHARGRLALYRCDDDEARRALRALAAFGGAADGVALPTGVSVVGWVDARTLASATARDEDGGRYPFVVQAGGETGLAVTLAARTSNERGAWLAALREVASYFRDLRREAAKVRRAAALERRAVAESAAAQLQAEVARSVPRPRRSSRAFDREHDETDASRRSRARWSSGPRATTWRGPATPSARARPTTARSERRRPSRASRASRSWTRRCWRSSRARPRPPPRRRGRSTRPRRASRRSARRPSANSPRRSSRASGRPRRRPRRRRPWPWRSRATRARWA